VCTSGNKVISELQRCCQTLVLEAAPKGATVSACPVSVWLFREPRDLETAVDVMGHLLSFARLINVLSGMH
jgi:hypothetical protein